MQHTPDCTAHDCLVRAEQRGHEPGTQRASGLPAKGCTCRAPSWEGSGGCTGVAPSHAAHPRHTGELSSFVLCIQGRVLCKARSARALHNIFKFLEAAQAVPLLLPPPTLSSFVRAAASSKNSNLSPACQQRKAQREAASWALCSFRWLHTPLITHMTMPTECVCVQLPPPTAPSSATPISSVRLREKLRTPQRNAWGLQDVNGLLAPSQLGPLVPDLSILAQGQAPLLDVASDPAAGQLPLHAALHLLFAGRY